LKLGAKQKKQKNLVLRQNFKIFGNSMKIFAKSFSGDFFASETENLNAQMSGLSIFRKEISILKY